MDRVQASKKERRRRKSLRYPRRAGIFSELLYCLCCLLAGWVPSRFLMHMDMAMAMAMNVGEIACCEWLALLEDQEEDTPAAIQGQEQTENLGVVD